jgi:hypothetical protein
VGFIILTPCNTLRGRSHSTQTARQQAVGKATARASYGKGECNSNNNSRSIGSSNQQAATTATTIAPRTMTTTIKTMTTKTATAAAIIIATEQGWAQQLFKHV